MNTVILVHNSLSSMLKLQQLQSGWDQGFYKCKKVNFTLNITLHLSSRTCHFIWVRCSSESAMKTEGYRHSGTHINMKNIVVWRFPYCKALKIAIQNHKLREQQK